jgi:hypothetical protein
MLRFILGFSLLLCLVIGASATFLYLLVDKSANLPSNAVNHLDHAEQVDSLLKQVQSSIEDRDKPSSILITETQLSSLQSLLKRAAVQLRSKAIINDTHSVLLISWETQHKGIKRYINAKVTIEQGKGLTLKHLEVGSMTFSGALATYLVKKVLNIYTQSYIGDAFFSSVESISMLPGQATVALNPLGPLLNELRRIKPRSPSKQDEQLTAYTAQFMRTLERYELTYGQQSRSLTDYIHVVFKEARAIQSTTERKSAVLVNEAAILSLAIFAGHYRVGMFVGNVQLDIDKPSVPNHLPTLSGRSDLSQHFIISAALKILAERGASLAIGEFKELMDRAEGGSGYSFIDLAADRAGVKFADMATNPTFALTIQRRLAKDLDEAAYFPDIGGLIEGLDKEDFAQRFGSIESQMYHQELTKINKRINRLPLYKR